jgi:Ni/Fe-hydrogenase subunit HybB-like protein
VGLGLALPLLLVAVPAARTANGTFVASVLALAGVLVDRLTFVLAGQIAPTSAAGVVAAPYASYTPSPVEIAILAGAAAFVAFAYTLAERYLDLAESDAHAVLPLAPLVARFRAWRRRPEVPA